MKKLIINSSILAMTLVMLSSCAATNKQYDSSRVILQNVSLDPVKADITIDESEKLSGTSKSTFFWIFQTSGDNSFADGVRFSASPLSIGAVNKTKSSAAYNALNSTSKEYDVLVHPKYSITVNRGFLTSSIKVTVDGYGGTYSNFRTEKQKIVILDGGKEIVLQDK